MTKTNYLISTSTENIINVTKSIFEDYIETLNLSNAVYEVKNFYHDYSKQTCKTTSYFMEREGKREVIAQIDIWEDKE